MGFLDAIDISASGLTAQRLRLDTIASNIANAETTRVEGEEGPYRRQVVVLEAMNNSNAAAKNNSFKNLLENKINDSVGQGVRVREIRSLSDAEEAFKRVYNPSHPDADADGYVLMPNVNIVEEMVNMISTSRAYEANTMAIDATRNMAAKALQIGS